jgi:hypothetical protein
VVCYPLSAIRVQDLDSPSMVTHSFGQRAWAEKTLPVRFWQARQWQIDTRTGSP